MTGHNQTITRQTHKRVGRHGVFFCIHRFGITISSSKARGSARVGATVSSGSRFTKFAGTNLTTFNGWYFDKGNITRAVQKPFGSTIVIAVHGGITSWANPPTLFAPEMNETTGKPKEKGNTLANNSRVRQNGKIVGDIRATYICPVFMGVPAISAYMPGTQLSPNNFSWHACPVPGAVLVLHSVGIFGQLREVIIGLSHPADFINPVWHARHFFTGRWALDTRSQYVLTFSASIKDFFTTACVS